MHIFHFQHSAIAKVEFSQDTHKLWTARIFPRPGVALEKLAALTANLNQKTDGIIAVPQSDKGVHTLYASGFDKPAQILGRLKALGYTEGKPRIEKTSEEADRYAERIREASLKWAGIFYIISDAALIAAGIAKGNKHRGETIAGIAYASVGLVMARYGHKNAHKHLEDLSIQLGDFFTHEGIAIPQNGPILGANNERKPQIIEGLERFAYTYPSQIFNTVVAYCGWNLLTSGMHNKNPATTASGALVMGGALAGLLIPEKTDKGQMPRPGAEKQQKTLFGRAYDWMQEKPLRIPGMLWFGNNIAMVLSGLKERRDNPASKAYMYKFGYAAAAIIANGLMFISSKESGKHYEADSESMQALLAVAASVITAQPKEMQDRIIEHTAGFLASQKGMTHTTHEIAKALREEVDELSKNPFLTHSEAPTTAPAQPQEKEFAKKHPPQARMENWQTMVNTSTDKPAAAASLT